jgi:hypothetical protein
MGNTDAKWEGNGGRSPVINVITGCLQRDAQNAHKLAFPHTWWQKA